MRKNEVARNDEHQLIRNGDTNDPSNEQEKYGWIPILADPKGHGLLWH